jgi:hypothetical protein
VNGPITWELAQPGSSLDVALFRYRLIGPALEDGLTAKQRGRVVRGIAGRVHAGPGGPACRPRAS